MNLDQKTQIQVLAGELNKVSNLRLHGDDRGIMLLYLSCYGFLGQIKQDLSRASERVSTATQLQSEAVRPRLGR